MTNFKIEFLYPWLLLLLIPMFALSFFLYFRTSKRYRRTRNRIVSMVLHFIVGTLAIVTLAGIHFTYEIPNMETEVILLVDTTYSGKSVEEQREHFIQDAINESKNTAQIGIVTFGYGEPVYAVPLTTDTENVYFDYENADQPDRTATDIATAIEFAKDLFKNKEVAKLIIISDGMETDGRAALAVKEAAAEGIEISSVYFPAVLPTQEIQVEGITTPDYNVAVGSPFKVTASIRSSYVGNALVEMFDNGEPCSEGTLVSLKEGLNEIEIEHTFDRPELHALSIQVSGGSDECSDNNVYQTYIYVQNYTKILMVERNADESKLFADLLKEQNEEFEIDTLDIMNLDTVPKTVDELRQYDQIVLVNIANADMPEADEQAGRPTAFIDLLYSYVNDFGGGLLTVGGNKMDENGNYVYQNGIPVANTYNREDMYETLYQEMLPVQAIDYTPPVAVMIVVDRSGSMDIPAGQNGQSKLELAKQGAKACLDALTDRDYCGIVTLEDKYTEAMEVSPMTQMAKLQKAIDDITVGGGTVFEDALRGAAQALQSVKNVERRHIILVTDGMPSDSYAEYSVPIEQYTNDVNAPVTFSFVIIGEDITASGRGDLQNAADLGGGRFYPVWDVDSLPRIMREELMMPEIKAINFEEFIPEIATYNSVVTGITQADMPKLSGFYGTKLKAGATMVLKGEFVPIYAQWKYGEGTVGSFMCDLNANGWATDFVASGTGKQILFNIINGLFPTKDIRPQSIDVELHEQNYTTQMSVYTKMAEGETIELEIASPDSNGDLTNKRTITPSEDGYSRITFAITDSGVHKLTVKKKDATGKVLAETTMYKAFSYSQEYNMFYDPEVGEELMTTMAISGNGDVIDEAYKIFQEIEKTLKRSYDPRIPFMIIALVLFLLDIAVRQFKFKWPHEIIRDAKAKKQLQQKSA